MNSVATATDPVGTSVRRIQFFNPLFFALLVAVLVFLFHARYSHSDYLLSDSADYVRAARAPLLQTYFNIDSASPAQLFQMRHDPAFRAHPWDYLYFHDDNAALRHFHTPVSFYSMHIVSLFTAADSYQRVVSSLVTAATCGVLVFGLASLGVPLSIATLTALVAGLQSRYVEVSVDPSPHGWYMLFAIVFLFAFARYLITRQFQTLALAAIFLGLAFATLEFSLELILSIPLALAVLWVLDRNALGNLKILVVSLLKAVPVFLVTTLILWPGGWIRGGYLESYGVTGSTLVFKNKSAFGSHDTMLTVFEKLLAGHEALLLLMAFALVATIVLILRRRLSSATIVFISYTAIAFGLGFADHFRLDTYISEALLFLFATVALLFRDSLAAGILGKRNVALSASILVLVVVGVQEWLHRPSSTLYQSWLKPVLIGVSSRVPAGSTILVNDNWEAYYAYLPQYDYEPTISETDLTPRSLRYANDVQYLLLKNWRQPVPDFTPIARFPITIPGQAIKLYLRGK